MNFLMLSIIMLFWILKWIIIFDIILSWLIIFWLKARPVFIANIIDPMYKYVKKYIPTNLWPFDFTPIIILIFMELIITLILSLNPDIYMMIKTISQ